MQNAFFIIAGLLLVVGAVIFWGFKPFGIVHILMLSAGVFILLSLVLGNKISKRYRNRKGKL